MAYYNKDFSNEPDGSKSEQVSWNIAADQAKHVAGLVKMATQFYQKGNIGQWFWTLSALRENINYDLKPNDRTILDEIEVEAKRYSIQWDNYRRAFEDGKEITSLGKMKSEFTAIVRKYMRTIMDCLKDLGYFPNKEDRTKLGF